MTVVEECFFFFFKQKTAYEIYQCDWSSDVCSSDLFFALRNSNSARDKDLSEKWKRRTSYFALIQILEDKHNPELEGKIKLFQFGVQIKEKLEMIANGDFDGESANNPFDLWTGLPLYLYIKEVTGDGGKRKYNNYTDSKFLHKPRPYLVNEIGRASCRERV